MSKIDIIKELLNKKYNNNFLELASEDMNLLEEFFDY